MAGEGDPNSGALYVKISERKACMVGMNAPTAAAVQLIHQTARR
jgi:hypothetical protein